MSGTEIVVLRHAGAGVREEWTGVDRSRPLDKIGLAQSLQLVDALAGIPLDRIWTSGFVRCQQTVTALASTRRLAVVERRWLRDGAPPAEVRAGLRAVAPHTLLCTHGATTRTIARLLAPDRRLDELDKAAAWVFRRAEDGAVTDVDIVDAPVGRELVEIRLDASSASSGSTASTLR